MKEDKRVPHVNSEGAKELKKAEEQFEAFDKKCRELTMDRMAHTPKADQPMQTEMGQRELAKKNEIYLKPQHSVSSRVKFNENFREAFEFDREFVSFIAENKECPGDRIEMWTKPYPGVPAEFWIIPTNRVVWGPRYLAEQVRRKSYHRLVMEPENFSDSNYVGSNALGKEYGRFVCDSTIQRLDAYPATTKRSVFMGAKGF